MPPKTSTKGKTEKQRKDNEAKEELPKDQPAKTEGETKQMVQEKEPAVVDGLSTSGKTQDELWEECVSLQEKLERVQRQKKHFKMERDMAQRSWDNSKRNLEETKARMREKLRLKQEAEKCRRAEIEEHEQKLKHLETAHHSEICGLKMAAIATGSMTQKEHAESEVELLKKLHNLQADKREKECHTKIYTGQLKQKQQDELRKLNESYKKQLREMECQYNNEKKIKVEENNQKIQAELDEIDNRMKKRAESVIVEHDEALSELNKYIYDTNGAGLERKRLEREFETAQKTDRRLNRRIEAAVQEKKRLAESVRGMKAKLCESRQQLVVQRKAMAKSLKKGKKVTAHILQERRELHLRHQQLEMKYEQVQQEYDELQKGETEAILDMQQKSGLKDMLSERRIKAVTEILEKEQLKLWVALAFGQGDQTAAKNIKELFESKHATIAALKDDVSRDLKEYDNLAEKATALGVSVDEWLPRCDIKKCISKASEDKNFDSLMQELMALCVSEDNSAQKGALGLNPAGAESSQ